MRFRVQMTCTSRLGEVNSPVAARKRVTGTNQAHHRSGTCNKDLAEQKKNSNVREHKKMIHVFFVSCFFQVYEDVVVRTVGNNY